MLINSSGKEDPNPICFKSKLLSTFKCFQLSNAFNFQMLSTLKCEEVFRISKSTVCQKVQIMISHPSYVEIVRGLAVRPELTI